MSRTRIGIVVLSCLVGILVAFSFLASCQRPRSAEASLGPTIRGIAERAEPRLRGRNLRFTGNILGIDGGNGVCACLKVCDANGENCTSCVCDPADCGSCD